MEINSHYSTLLHSQRWSNAVFILFATILFTGCDKDNNEDLTPPQISVLNTVPAVTSDVVCGAVSDRVIKMEMGGSLQLDVRFTDSSELGSAKFDLHQNFDCHGHKSMVWNVIEIIELSGKSQDISKTFVSPENVRTGNYHLGVMALDASGQEAEMIYFDLLVYDPDDTIPPVVQVSNPWEGAQLSKSTPMGIAMNVTDETSLNTGGFEITFIDGAGTELSVVRQDFPAETGAEFTLDTTYNIPGFAQIGECAMKVEAKDWRNNTTIQYIHFILID